MRRTDKNKYKMFKSQEQRRTTRSGRSCEVYYQGENTNLELRGFTKDICVEGICLIVKDEFPDMSKGLKIIHPRLNHFIKLDGKIVWKSQQSKSIANIGEYMAVGIEFDKLRDQNLDFLGNLVEEDLLDRARFEKLNAIAGFSGRLSRRSDQPLTRPLPTTSLAFIAGVASYLPPKKVSNEDIVREGLDATATAIYRGLGVRERRSAESSETSIDMMVKVAQQILAERDIDPLDLDRIICSVDPPEAVAPNSAVAVQERIGAKCPAFEVSMSCAGWVCGIDFATRCIATGEEMILVLAANRVGSALSFKNLMHRAIFGDGAGGVLIAASDESKILATSLWSDGSHYADIFVPLPWSKTPAAIPLDFKGYFYMNPEPQVFNETMRHAMPHEFQKLLSKACVSKDDIDLFLLHEPSKPLYDLSIKLLGIPKEKTFQTFEYCGNTVSAEMPILLAEAIRERRVKKGDIVLIFTYGAGFTMGSMIFEL